jgi:DNA-binding CsgD family transcriptional regulator
MPTQRQQIIALRNKGMTRKQMAIRLGISENAVGSFLHQLLKNGVITPISPQEARRRQQRAVKKVDVDEARRLRRAGWSYNEIAMRYGVSGPTISKLLGSTLRITPLQRQLIRLHSRGLTYNAIAAKVDRPEGTVAVVLARLVRKGLLPPRSR